MLDQTLTPMGARLLRIWISQPLLDQRSIEERLVRVDALYANTLLRAQLRETLKNMPRPGTPDQPGHQRNCSTEGTCST